MPKPELCSMMHPMDYRGRFAPSPTGLLHFGSLVGALGSWLRARHAGGQWLVRIEDIDPPREVPGSADAMLAALAAHGMVADEPPLWQSNRSAAYIDALHRLRAGGHVFECWCSRTDLAADGGVHRDGCCERPTDSTCAPASRLRVPDLAISFHDQLQGPQWQNLREEVGDFVLQRADGFFSYHLACVVDDAFQGITEVVRGCDLLDSTPRQMYLQGLLGLPTPSYVHLPLALDAAGAKLSKSAQAPRVTASTSRQQLHAALRFLRQPLTCEDKDSGVGSLLAMAAAGLDLSTLQGIRDQPVM